MAYPKLLQKLFQNEGAGPLLRRDIMPTAMIGSDALTSKTASSSTKLVAVDGGVHSAVSPNSAFYAGVANNAGAHNSIYRGTDLTSRHANGSLSTQVQAGDFTDIFIGDYITATTTANGNTVTTNWRVADIDYYLRCGDTETTAHHLVLVPDVCLFNAYMNSSDTTSGGYQGSAMWKTYIPMCVTAIKNAFGASHVLAWRQLLSNAVNTSLSSMAGAGWTGATSGWSWVDASADLMNEPQLYGTTVFSSSFHDVANRKSQFALFRFDRSKLQIRADFWLSAVSSGTFFAGCGSYGNARGWGASGVVGVRPHFLYH